MTGETPRPPRILAITNNERGEANVFLNTFEAILQVNPHAELHFATFKGLEAPVASIAENARLAGATGARPVTFHRITGLCMGEALAEYFRHSDTPKDKNYLPLSLRSPLGFRTTTRAIRDSVPIFVPYNAHELATVVQSIIDTIRHVDADHVVIDTLMVGALTACYHLGIKFTCLSPNSIKEFALPDEPNGAAFWKFPALFSGFSYPVPWHKELAAQTGITLRTSLELLKNRPEGLQVLVSTLPELDFPVHTPDYVHPCGPIIHDPQSITEADPSLAAWLSRGPTIYVNMGSLCRLNEDEALDMARSLKTILDAELDPAKTSSNHGSNRAQVLWKLKKLDHYEIGPGSKIYQVIGSEIEADRVHIFEWLDSDPVAVLQSGHVVCSVHHGGANSYNEAVIAGVPQVVLPQWTDCYDYAQRAEFHGIGRQGNKSRPPQWNPTELSRALAAVVVDQGSVAMRRKAQELSKLCQSRGKGADNAARILLEQCKVTC